MADVLTKDLFNKLHDDNVTHKEYLRILSLIDVKVSDVWEFIVKKCGGRVDWWDYDNVDIDAKEDGRGGFSPEAYRDTISVIGEWSNCKLPPIYGKYCSYKFPTSYLWTDYEQIVTKEIEDHKLAEAAEKSEKLKRKVFRLKTNSL